MPPIKGRLAIGVERSKNHKLGRASATYASQKSCPLDCPLLGSGCYAEFGHIGRITRDLNAAETAGALQVAREEAREIDALSGRRPLRLHAVGDSRTRKGTRRLAAAAGRYRARHGQPVWAYTHAWRTVPRSDWGEVSVLASCEDAEQVKAARARGYATALVVDTFPSHQAYDVAPGVRVIPCPAQTFAGTTCTSCRLCFDADRLHRQGLTIGFSAHGAGRRRALQVIS